MDYIPVNIARKGEQQGQFWQTTPGPWDYWAIEYAYKPVTTGPRAEKEELEKIASRVADPLLVYGTDEDALGFSLTGIDPLTSPYDLGNDPVEFYESRIDIANELWNNIEENFERDGDRYPKMRRVFQQGLSQYYLSVLTVPKFIGGIYFHRDHVGDPNGRLPFVPVSAEKQRNALRFITNKIFNRDAFHFQPDFLNKLAPDRQWTFFFNFGGRIDFPFHQIILAIQRYPLMRLYNPSLLQRILDNELRNPAGEPVFTLAEMFGELRNAIWAELERPANINSFRRNLQRTHLQRLIDLALGRYYGTPSDAVALARHDIKVLEEKIEEAIKTGMLDQMSSIHLEDLHDRINTTLNAEAIINLR